MSYNTMLIIMALMAFPCGWGLADLYLTWRGKC